MLGSVVMKQWQQDGYESFKTWSKAKDKAKREAQKAKKASAAVGSAPATPPAPHAATPPMPATPPPPSLPAASAERAPVHSPPLKKQRTDLAEPVRVELTPRCGNVRLILQAETPGGTLLEESFKRVAVSPGGENADARVTRLATERKRLHRARERLAAQLQQRQEAVLFAVGEFAATVSKDVEVEELAICLERLNPLMETADDRKSLAKFEAAKQACAVVLPQPIECYQRGARAHPMMPCCHPQPFGGARCVVRHRAAGDGA